MKWFYNTHQQTSLRVPDPPFFGISRQAGHTSQSSVQQPTQFPQRCFHSLDCRSSSVELSPLFVSTISVNSFPLMIFPFRALADNPRSSLPRLWHFLSLKWKEWFHKQSTFINSDDNFLLTCKLYALFLILQICAYQDKLGILYSYQLDSQCNPHTVAAM